MAKEKKKESKKETNQVETKENFKTKSSQESNFKTGN